MIFIIFLLLVAVDAASFQDEQIVDSLFNILTCFQRRRPSVPVKPKPFIQIQQNNVDILSRLPFDQQHQIIFNYLDIKSRLRLSQANSKNFQIYKHGIQLKLSCFNPFLLTENNDKASAILANILCEHFQNSTTLHSPHIHDELQLLTFKFMVGTLDYSKEYYYLILLFLYELVYGLDSPICFPSSISQCKGHFAHLATSSNVSLTKCLDYISLLDHPEIPHVWVQQVALLYHTSNGYDIMDSRKFSKNSDISISAALIEINIEKLSDDLVILVFSKIYEVEFFSKVIFDRFAKVASKDSLISIFNSTKIGSYRYKSSTAKVLKARFNCSQGNLAMYLYSRTSENRFSVSEFRDYLNKTEAFQYFLTVEFVCSLAQLEMNKLLQLNFL
jgi:hypothetical protein